MSILYSLDAEWNPTLLQSVAPQFPFCSFFIIEFLKRGWRLDYWDINEQMHPVTGAEVLDQSMELPPIDPSDDYAQLRARLQEWEQQGLSCRFDMNKLYPPTQTEHGFCLYCTPHYASLLLVANRMPLPLSSLYTACNWYLSEFKSVLAQFPIPISHIACRQS